jgi:hypothetical protein
MNGFEMRGSIVEYPGQVIVTVQDARITPVVFQRARRQVDREELPVLIQFPPEGQEVLDPRIRDAIETRFREQQRQQDEKEERADQAQQGPFRIARRFECEWKS